MLPFYFVKQLSQIGIIFTLGMIWNTYYVLTLKHSVPDQYLYKPIKVIGTIASVPKIKARRVQFEYLIDNINDHPQKSFTRVLLSHYNYQQGKSFLPHLGERWKLMIRLKQPRGFWNQGSFDYERWLFQNKIQLIGTTLNRKTFYFVRIAPFHYSYYQAIRYTILTKINSFRSTLSIYIQNSVRHKENIGFLNALVTGMREDILQQHWQVMQATGTTHLFSISGLHIGFISGIFYKLSSFLWRQSKWLGLYWPAQEIGILMALLGALSYSILSGFALPVKRVMLTSILVSGSVLRRRVISSWLGWSSALILLLLFDPTIVLSVSFWFSFWAVAILLVRLNTQSLFFYRKTSDTVWFRFLKEASHIQWMISIGLIPLTIFFFHQINYISFVVNLFTISWIGFIVLPITMAGTFISLISPTVGILFIQIGEKTFEILWDLLCKIAALPFVQRTIYIDNTFVFSSIIVGIGLFFLPYRFPARNYLKILYLLPVLFLKSEKPDQGEVWLTLLDVGQGLSAVIRTRNHTLVYDTGPAFNEFFDTGEAVVLPYLNTLGIKKIDKLIISHGDNDHSGGAKSIIKKICIQSILIGHFKKIHPFNQSVCFCRMGQTWQWDGVTFCILHPPKTQQLKGNDASCVLRIDNGKNSILLPGDIQKKAESILMQNHLHIKSTVLIAPHHGSKTSSSIQFIKAVQPRYVLFPTGYRNQFNFPSKEVVKRFQQQGCQIYDTAERGAITVKLRDGITIDTYRKLNKKLWHMHIINPIS